MIPVPIDSPSSARLSMVTTLGEITAAAFATEVLPTFAWSTFAAVTTGLPEDPSMPSVTPAANAPPTNPPASPTRSTRSSEPTRPFLRGVGSVGNVGGVLIQSGA